MSKQVSIKVYFDDELYQFYAKIESGRKGQIIRDALNLYKELQTYSKSGGLAELLAEIRQGFARIEGLLQACPDASLCIQQHQLQEKSKPAKEADIHDMADMFAGFIKMPEA
jgi:hypothetical protein